LTLLWNLGIIENRLDMSNILEFVDRLRGLKTELEATQAKKLSEDELLRLEQERQRDEGRKVNEKKQRTLEEYFKPILESVKKELLRGEGILRTDHFNHVNNHLNPILELEWGSQYEMGGARPTHRIAAIYEDGIKFTVEFGWDVNGHQFSIDKKDWKNDLFESISIAFKEDKCRESRSGQSSPDN